MKKDALYIFGLNPKDAQITVKSLAKSNVFRGIVKDVSLLGFDGKLKFNQDESGFKTQLPDGQIGSLPFVLKVKFSGNKF